MNKYSIVSGKLKYIDVILEDGTGPTEYYRCCLEIEAKNKMEARKIAIRDIEFKDWVNYKRENNECPLAGLEVKRVMEE